MSQTKTTSAPRMPFLHRRRADIAEYGGEKTISRVKLLDEAGTCLWEGLARSQRCKFNPCDDLTDPVPRFAAHAANSRKTARVSQPRSKCWAHVRGEVVWDSESTEVLALLKIEAPQTRRELMLHPRLCLLQHGELLVRLEVSPATMHIC